MKSLEFFRLQTREEVLALYPRFPPVGVEEVPLAGAGGRVLAEALPAPEDVPAFPRSSMDGYAVRAADTFGAGVGAPQYLRVRGEVPMAAAPERSVGPEETLRVPTGAMLPQGADAVVMLEYTAEHPDGTLEVRRAVAPGENVLNPGEDVHQGEVLLPAGRRLLPQDLGLLAALGVTRLRVFRRPRVAILSSGDEIVPVDALPGPGRVRDTNAVMAAAQVQEWGGLPILRGIVPDDLAALKTALAAALADSDLVLVSGGSSVGARDLTLAAIQAQPAAQVLVHGVAIRPGKPTILAAVRGGTGGEISREGGTGAPAPAPSPGSTASNPYRGVGGESEGRVIVSPSPPLSAPLIPLLGLPGHPASAAVVMEVLGRPLLERLSGLAPRPSWGGAVPALLSRNLAGASGREDYVRVRLRVDADTLWADPVLGPSGLISPLVKSHGLVMIPLGTEGLFKGEEVSVQLFDRS